MAIKTEMKEIKVSVCDFCGQEAHILKKCAVCKQDMCLRENGRAHAAFMVLRITRFKKSREKDDNECSYLYVCEKCTISTLNLPLGELLAGMMSEEFSFKKFEVKRGC